MEEAVLVSKKLFGLEFVEINDVQKYHPEVKPMKSEVRSQKTEVCNDFVVLLYADYHPRKGKRASLDDEF